MIDYIGQQLGNYHLTFLSYGSRTCNGMVSQWKVHCLGRR